MQAHVVADSHPQRTVAGLPQVAQDAGESAAEAVRDVLVDLVRVGTATS